MFPLWRRCSIVARTKRDFSLFGHLVRHPEAAESMDAVRILSRGCGEYPHSTIEYG